MSQVGQAGGLRSRARDRGGRGAAAAARRAWVMCWEDLLGYGATGQGQRELAWFIARASFSLQLCVWYSILFIEFRLLLRSTAHMCQQSKHTARERGCEKCMGWVMASPGASEPKFAEICQRNFVDANQISYWGLKAWGGCLLKQIR